MGNIFETRPGVAVALPDPFDKPIPLVLEGWGGFADTKCILTQLAVMRQGNFQFLHTLEDLIFVYVFGERIGQMQIAGLALADRCMNGGAVGGISGIESVFSYYDENAISRRPTPLTIQIGTTGAGRFKGFMTGFRSDLIRPEGRISQFAFMLHTFPNASHKKSK